MASKPKPYEGYRDTAQSWNGQKVYVAGPMRGIEDFNFPAFDAAAYELRKAGGYFVFNPAERDREVHGPDVNKSPTGDFADTPEFDLRSALADDLNWICRNADIVVVLPGWENSKGARAEVATAETLGLEVTTVSELVWGEPVESPRASVLTEAKTLITGDRNNTYGPPTQDFQRTADMATAWGFRVGDQPLQAYHVAIFMILLKMSRLRWTPGKRDSWVDTGGYAGCGYECAVEDGESAA